MPIYVTAERRERLVAGTLAIARYGKGFALIPPAIAEKIRERGPEAVVDLAAAPLGERVIDVRQ